MCGVLCDVMTAFANWLYGQELFSAVDPCLLTKHDAPVVEEDVWHQGEWPTWLILLEPTVVTFDYSSLAFEFIVTQLLSWRKLLWHEERQVTTRLDSLVDAGRCRFDDEGCSEIAFGIDAFGAHRPQWSRLCGHGPDSTDVVFDRAVVGNVDAAAWVAYRWLEGETEPSGLTDGGGHRPEEEDDSGNRNGDGADDRSPTGNRAEHGDPVGLRGSTRNSQFQQARVHSPTTKRSVRRFDLLPPQLHCRAHSTLHNDRLEIESSLDARSPCWV